MNHLLISGSNGFIGSALVPFLQSEGHKITRLVRQRPPLHSAAIVWNPGAEFNLPHEAHFDAVVHLAGESIVGFWTTEKKRRIKESRVNGTLSLCRALAKLAKPPAMLICASAIGLYGDCGEKTADEDSPYGAGFLAEVCRDWEAACEPAHRAGMRVINLRLGAVLSPRGGILGRLIPIFKLGLGGRLGNGNQAFSWLALQDLLAIVSFCLKNKNLSGPINATSPNPLPNREFTKLLATALGRPAFCHVPALALRLLFGGMAEEVLLRSSNVQPRKLLAAGYKFIYPHLEDLLSAEIRLPAENSGTPGGRAV